MINCLVYISMVIRYKLFLSFLIVWMSALVCFADGPKNDSSPQRSVIYIRQNSEAGVSLQVNESVLKSVGKEVEFKLHRICKYIPTDKKWVEVEHRQENTSMVKPLAPEGGAVNSSRTLAELPKTTNLFHLEWFENKTKFNGSALSGPVSCNDVMIGEPPEGMVAACVPFEDHASAMFVPAPEIHCQE